MGNLIKLLILAAIAYGIYWVAQNVDFNQAKTNATQQIKQEKIITKVNKGREQAFEDARRVAE